MNKISTGAGRSVQSWIRKGPPTQMVVQTPKCLENQTVQLTIGGFFEMGGSPNHPSH